MNVAAGTPSAVFVHHGTGVWAGLLSEALARFAAPCACRHSPAHQAVHEACPHVPLTAGAPHFPRGAKNCSSRAAKLCKARRCAGLTARRTHQLEAPLRQCVQAMPFSYRTPFVSPVRSPFLPFISAGCSVCPSVIWLSSLGTCATACGGVLCDGVGSTLWHARALACVCACACGQGSLFAGWFNHVPQSDLFNAKLSEPAWNARRSRLGAIGAVRGRRADLHVRVALGSRSQASGASGALHASLRACWRGLELTRTALRRFAPHASLRLPSR